MRSSLRSAGWPTDCAATCTCTSARAASDTPCPNERPRCPPPRSLMIRTSCHIHCTCCSVPCATARAAVVPPAGDAAIRHGCARATRRNMCASKVGASPPSFRPSKGAREERREAPQWISTSRYMQSVRSTCLTPAMSLAPSCLRLWSKRRAQPLRGCTETLTCGGDGRQSIERTQAR